MYKNKNVERAVKWAKNNPEKYKINQKRYRDKRRLLLTDEEKTKIRNRSKTWRINNPEEYKKLKREYMRRRRSDPVIRDKLNKRKREWDEKNVEHNKQYRKERHLKIYKNDIVNRGRILDRQHQRQINKRLEVLYWYSDGKMICKECGTPYYEFLAIDHVDNNGYEHRSSGELKKYSNNIINYLIANNFPDGYQVLCHNCNQIKRINLLNPKDSASTRHRKKIRKLMLKKYSNNDIKCKYCSEKDERCLTFHHVNGRGTRHKRECNYSSFPEYLFKNNLPISDIVVACQNCNKSFGHYGYLPFNFVSHQ